MKILRSPNSRTSRGFDVILYAGLGGLLLIILIWGPFGIEMLGLIEEWQLPPIFDANGVFLVATANSPLPTLQLRPLTIAPQAVAYALDPNSFAGWHVLQMASFAAKAMGMAYIAWWLTRRTLWAVFAGLLLVVFPADAMQISLRALHINWALVLATCGVALLLAATETHRSWVRLLMAGSASAFFLAGTLMYEAGLFFAPVPLLLWWARYGIVEGVQRLWRQPLAVAMWAAAIVGTIGYLVVVGSTPNFASHPLTGGLTATLQGVLSRAPFLYETALYRVFAHGWIDAFLMLREESTLWIYLAGVPAIDALGMLLDVRHDADEPARLLTFLPRLVLAAVLITAVGYLPYLSSPAHMVTSQRTYIFASVGGALGVATLVYLVRQINRELALLAATLLLCLGLAQQWGQMIYYIDLSAKQRMLLAGAVQGLAEVGPKQQVLVLDRTGYLENTWTLRGVIFDLALTYLRKVSTRTVICSPVSGQWESFTVSDLGRPGTCRELPDRWVIGEGAVSSPTVYRKSELVVIDIDPDGHVTRLDAPQGTLSSWEIARYENLLKCTLATSCLYRPASSNTYRQDFGRRWSIEESWWGAGWVGPAWLPPTWTTPIQSVAWINAPVSNLNFMIQPTDDPYRLRIGLINAASVEAREHLTVTLNGKQLAMEDNGAPLVGGAAMTEALIPPGALVDGRNQLIFHTPADPRWSTTLALNYIDIRAARH